MDDVVDEFGNPVQLTDDHGNPVQLTDEHGNPMHLTGVALHGGPGDMLAAESWVEVEAAEPPLAAYDGGWHRGAEGERKLEELEHRGGLGAGKHEKPEGMGSSTSSEDDGQGVRRRKKGLKEKLKEKLGVGKLKDKDEQSPYPTLVTGETHPGKHHQHEKKSMTEKIKEKLPGHH